MSRPFTLALLSLTALPSLAFAQAVDDPGLAGRSAPATAPAAVPTVSCPRKSPCPQRGELFRRLLGPDARQAKAAIETLKGWRDPRVLAPLARATVYAADASVKRAASLTLEHLAGDRGLRALLQRLEQVELDLAVRRAFSKAIAAAGGLPPAPAKPNTPNTPTAPEGPARLFDDPDPTRLIYSPTAFTREPGRWNWTIYNIAYWSFDYGINEYVEVGLQTIPPIGAFMVLPHVKVGFDLAENVRLAINVTGGAAYPYIENDDDVHVLAFGGGPILTIGTPDLMFNASVTAYYVALGEEDYDYSGFGPGNKEMNYESVWSITPALGFSWRFAKRVKLNLELHTPLGDHDYNGELWMLLYGVRIFGERIYGDVSFVVPFSPYMDEYLKYFPIGFPLLAFGFQW